MPDEQFAANLFDRSGPDGYAESLGKVAEAGAKIGNSFTWMMTAAEAADKLNTSTQALLRTTQAFGNVAQPTLPGMMGGGQQNAAATQPAAESASTATDKVSSAVNALGVTMQTSISSLGTRLETVFTNLFNRANTTAGYTVGSQAPLPGTIFGGPPAGPSVGGEPAAGGIGAGGGGGTPAASSGGGGGLSPAETLGIMGALGGGAGAALEVAGAAGLYGAGMLNRASSKTTSTGNQWTQAGYLMAPFANQGYDTKGMQATTAAMQGGPNGGFGGGVQWGGNIAGLGASEAELNGINGNAFNAQGGTQGFKTALSQASAFGVVSQQGLQTGANATAWLATAAGRNFLYTIGLSPTDPKNQNVTGVAENIAARLNGGTFPNTKQLQAMIGPGQPLTNTLYYLLGNMGMPNVDSAVQSLQSVLMQEAATVQTGANGQSTYISLGSATSGSQVASDERALKLQSTPYYKNQQASQNYAIANRPTAVQNAEKVAQNNLTTSQAVRALVNDVPNLLREFFGALEGDLKTILPMVLPAANAAFLAYKGVKAIKNRGAAKAKAKGKTASEDDTSDEATSPKSTEPDTAETTRSGAHFAPELKTTAAQTAAADAAEAAKTAPGSTQPTRSGAHFAPELKTTAAQTAAADAAEAAKTAPGSTQPTRSGAHFAPELKTTAAQTAAADAAEAAKTAPGSTQPSLFDEPAAEIPKASTVRNVTIRRTSVAKGVEATTPESSKPTLKWEGNVAGEDAKARNEHEAKTAEEAKTKAAEEARTAETVKSEFDIPPEPGGPGPDSGFADVGALTDAAGIFGPLIGSALMAYAQDNGKLTANALFKNASPKRTSSKALAAIAKSDLNALSYAGPIEGAEGFAVKAKSKGFSVASITAALHAAGVSSQDIKTGLGAINIVVNINGDVTTKNADTLGRSIAREMQRKMQQMQMAMK